MGRFEKRSQNSRAGDPLAEADTALRAVTEELQTIQRTVLKSLQEDIQRLQAEKLRLANDVQRLQQEKEDLLQGRQFSDLQPLLSQLAQVLANHISSQLKSSLETLANQAVEKDNAVANQVLGSLDDTLTITFNTLQQEVKNYQNNLSQQLSRMSIQQQQGEEILAELVNRLHGELVREELTTTKKGASPPTVIQFVSPFDEEPTEQQQDIIAWEDKPTEQQNEQQQDIIAWEDKPTEQQNEQQQDIIAWEDKPTEQQQHVSREVVTKLQQTDTISQPIAPQSSLPKEAIANHLLPTRIVPKRETRPPTAFVPTPPPPEEYTPAPPPSRVRRSSIPAIGLLLVVLSTVATSLYNVAIKVVFNPGTLIFGVFEVERLLPPTLGNSLLILMLRMLIVVPLMLVLAPMMHPQVWQDLQSLIQLARAKSSTANAQAKQLLLLSIVSGCFLFLSQVLIYIAIGQIAVGMAITLLFIYPAISGLLAWFLFRDQPNSFRLKALACICLGQMLVLAGSTTIGTGNVLGSTTAIASGVTFAVYVILTRICAAKLHPVSFTLINFATVLLLSFIGLMLPLPMNWSLLLNPNNLLELILSAFILGVFTLFGYLFNNVGIRKLGATRSAIVGATIPALTVILAGFLIQENLQPIQVLGVLLVTGGTAAVSYEKMRNRNKVPRSKN
ncbi:MAG: EamA family transporter [Fischerella sp.]|uniref:DMT family transporter n=1 Tax=Fischerella sp. TaxID=1191 RepID=UPI0017A2ED8E|nr:DMT family transporter [Fischerella sp.]NWF58497.1 EamA family transporter [Fischerella sp.]